VACSRLVFTKWQRDATDSKVATYDVGEEQFGGVFAVVPMTVVDPLPQQLDRRLRSVLLLGRHVEVVDERDTLLAERRPVHALPSPRFTHAQLALFLFNAAALLISKPH